MEDALAPSREPAADDRAEDGGVAVVGVVGRVDDRDRARAGASPEGGDEVRMLA